MALPSQEPLTIRLPNGMRDRIRRNAAANRRSMNSEIVHYLDRALEAQEAKGPAGTAIPPSHGHSNPQQGTANERQHA